MKLNENFLSKYKELEQVLRAQGIDYKDFEEESEFKERLRLCRITRNFLSHNNDPSFVSISTSQIKFLDQMIKEQKSKGDICKKHLGSPLMYTCKITDKCWDVLAKMSKKKIKDIVVIGAKGEIMTSNVYNIIQVASTSKTKRMSDVKKDVKNIHFHAPDELLEDIPRDGIGVCTSTGDATGKLLGIILL